MKRTLYVDLSITPEGSDGHVDKWEVHHRWRLSVAFTWANQAHREPFASRLGRVIRHQSVMDEILITAATP